MNKIIEVIVSPVGEIKIQTKGFAGNNCRQATAELEAALGAKSSERMTPEFYQNRENCNSAREGQS